MAAQHSTYYFPEQNLTITGNFDSGNLGEVQLIDDNKISILCARDCADQGLKLTARSWFHFKILCNPGSYYKIVLRNWQFQKLYQQGLQPFVKTELEDWHRVPCKLKMVNKSMHLVIPYTFMENSATFSMLYPWSYEDNQFFLQELEQNHNIRRELLCLSPQGRRCDLLTIGNDVENNQVVVISARVHPGELPASHIMNGLIKFLLSDDVRAQAIRDNLTLKIVPFLNPDGVFLGHMRFDQFGKNLNRSYGNPDPETEPTIYSLQNLVMQIHEQGKFYMHVDLHAHANKKGCFLFGNNFNFAQQVETCQLAYLMSRNSPFYSLLNSVFTKSLMSVKDKTGTSREGSARVGLYHLTGNLRIYTLECNYNIASKTNSVPYIDLDEKYEEDNIQSEIFKDGPPFFTKSILESIGRQLLISIFDVYGNPYTRVTENVHLHTAKWLIKRPPYKFYKQLQAADDEELLQYALGQLELKEEQKEEEEENYVVTKEDS